MAYYAKCDPTVTQPAPVIGYYDTSFDPYTSVDFTAVGFIELTAEQWVARTWDSYISAGTLIPKPTS